MHCFIKQRLLDDRYVGSDGAVKSRSLGVRALDQTTADAITDSIKEILAANSLPVESMVGLATDGTSVMTGVNRHPYNCWWINIEPIVTRS